MWVRRYSKAYQGVSKDEVWKVWKDIDHWVNWHDDLDYCKLLGKFAVGHFFMLKPKGAPAVKIELTEIVEGVKFTDCTRFFGAKMTDTHELEETEEGLRLTNILTVTGPLKWLWIKLVAQHVADTVPDENQALVDGLLRRHCG